MLNVVYLQENLIRTHKRRKWGRWPFGPPGPNAPGPGQSIPGPPTFTACFSAYSS